MKKIFKFRVKNNCHRRLDFTSKIVKHNLENIEYPKDALAFNCVYEGVVEGDKKNIEAFLNDTDTIFYDIV